MRKTCAHCKGGNGNHEVVRPFQEFDMDNQGYNSDVDLHPGCVGRRLLRYPNLRIESRPPIHLPWAGEDTKMWCHNERHATPCPQPCQACQEECDPSDLRPDSGEDEA